MSYLGLGMMVIGALIVYLDGGKDFNSYKETVNDLKGEIQTFKDYRIQLDRSLTEISTGFSDQLMNNEKTEQRVKSVEKEIVSVQDHLAKTRESLMRLREKITPKKVQVTHVGAIPVEIHQSLTNNRKDLVNKVKKQLQVLEK
jgi:predicted  nucleic acid-binding Zn-ribbon protein